MNKCLIIIFFCINLCDFLTAKEPIGYRKIDDSCEISDESFKTINVISNHGLADSCSLLISASPEADDDFDIQLRITKDSNICDTGIEYVDTENPKITSVKDDGVVICSFKIYLNIIEKLEKTQGYRNIDDSCELSAESIKTISVISRWGLPDSCSLVILASPEEDDDYDVKLKITKDSNVCDTGIGYVDPENPKITSVKDDAIVICSFRIHLNIIEKLEETRGFKYLGKDWKILNSCKEGRLCVNSYAFFMNTAQWWRDNKYNFLFLRPSIVTWEYSDTDYKF
ncbi:hypothetical protein HCN44_006729 [Aphidius gifuensis]|uniref:Odorant-binding protein n=1 Tax=Aphidius gifuensis TaxID=684658 RepID=A0A834Y0P2_APHGI|nr:hypothetical protein HCN44_006729 [Aphidius gifuensis]